MADTYLTWWTSIEVDLRKSLVINAMRDHGAMHSLIRNAFEAGLSSTTPPSPSTAPEVDERAAFEAWIEEAQTPYIEGEEWPAIEVKKAWMIWQAALASRPAEVDDEGLPKLPEHFGRFNVNGPDGHRIKGYTAEQYRQGQRDAVAADRARRAGGRRRPVILNSITHTARRSHLCASCGRTVHTGEQYVRAPVPGGPQAKRAFHSKCYAGLVASGSKTNSEKKEKHDGQA